MASMLRPIARSSGRSAAFLNRASTSSTKSPLNRLMSTQSGDDTKAPSALATLYLEDGSKFVGRSFGSHEAAVDGEVSERMQLFLVNNFTTRLTSVLIYLLNNKSDIYLCTSCVFFRLCSPPEWLVILKR